MSSSADIIFQIAEAVSAISLPIGGGLAAYSKWRKTAEQNRNNRVELARVAAENATKEARKEEQSMRDRLLQEKDDRIRILNEEVEQVRAENERLHDYIITLLRGRGDSTGEDSAHA